MLIREYRVAFMAKTNNLGYESINLKSITATLLWTEEVAHFMPHAYKVLPLPLVSSAGSPMAALVVGQCLLTCTACGTFPFYST